MIPRRQLLTGGLAAGAFGGVALNADADAAPVEPAAAQQQTTERSVREVAEAVRSVRDELRAPRNFPEIRAIREAQKTFLRANSKLPDYLEVGIDVWFAAHDWHITWQQPL